MTRAQVRDLLLATAVSTVASVVTAYAVTKVLEKLDTPEPKRAALTP